MQYVNNSKSMFKSRGAFTLVELLVVIAIIGLLSTVAVVSTTSSREKARLASASSYAATIQRNIGAEAAAVYDFEDGAGTTAVSTVGSGSNNATITGATWSTDTNGSNSKSSLSFSGSDYLTTAGGFGIANTNFTIALWIKTTSTGGQVYVVTGPLTGGSGFRFGLTGGRIAYYMGNGVASPTEVQCGTQTVNDGKWHHLVGEYNRSGSKFVCYIDGRQVGSVAWASTYPNMLDAAARIGTGHCCTAFVGLLDDVRIYAQNLSGVAINDLYNEGKKRLAAKDIRFIADF